MVSKQVRLQQLFELSRTHALS